MVTSIANAICPPCFRNSSSTVKQEGEKKVWLSLKTLLRNNFRGDLPSPPFPMYTSITGGAGRPPKAKASKAVSTKRASSFPAKVVAKNLRMRLTVSSAGCAASATGIRV